MRAGSILSIVLVGALLLAGGAVLIPLLTDDTVTVAFSDKSNYETLIVANELGYLDEAGIRPLLVTGGIRAAEALVTGSADMAAMGDGPAVSTISQHDNVKIVARFINGEGMHRFIAYTDIQTPKDLENKSVGLQQGSSTHGAFLRWMQANDVDADKVTIVPMVPSDIALAMQSGVNGTRQIHAMAGSEPWAINTERLCGSAVHEIGNSSGQGSTFPITLLATQRVIDNHPDKVREMIDILVRSNEFILENWDEAMEICYVKTGVANAEEQSRCSAIQGYDVGFNETDIQSLEMAAQVLVDFGRLTSIPNISLHTDLRFLPEVE